MNSMEILLNSSVYAVSQIGKSKCVFNKVMWLLILVFAFLGSSYQIYLFMNVYLDYPIVVNLQMDQQEKMPFPAVTICNINRMNSMCEEWLHTNCTPITGDAKPRSIPGLPPLVLPERRGSIGDIFKKENKGQAKLLEKYYKLSPSNRIIFGYSLNEVIENCSFNFSPCEFYHSLNMRYGNCYTFNKLKGVLATSTGASNGLKMTLRVDPDHYLPVSHTVGIKIVIHDPTDEPDPEVKGFNIPPGYETDIALKETVMRRLPAPYPDKCVFYGGEEEPLVKSRIHCMKSCIQEYNLARCGCVEAAFSTNSEHNHCDMFNSTEVNCLDSMMKDLSINGSNCQCPHPCLSKNYNEQITRVLWPSRAYFLHSNLGEIDEIAFKTYRKSHAKVRIFFSTLERSTYEQKPMFQPSEMFGCLGGEFALWLGISLFAFCELIEVVLFFINHFVCNCKERIDLFSTSM